jgi:LacI family transcriptional regulator
MSEINEKYAAISLQLAQKYGFKVPDDIAVIGFTDGDISKVTDPPLSTIAQYGFEMGERAMEILLERIQEKNKIDPQKVIIIKTSLIERLSSMRKPDKN